MFYSKEECRVLIQDSLAMLFFMIYSKILASIAININNILPSILSLVRLEHENDHDFGKAIVERCTMVSLLLPA